LKLSQGERERKKVHFSQEFLEGRKGKEERKRRRERTGGNSFPIACIYTKKKKKGEALNLSKE